MNIPETFRGMKKVKEYPNFVLYIDKYGRRECFQHWDLGHTEHIKIREGFRCACAK